MTETLRTYRRGEDFDRVSELLTRHHRPGNSDGNWLQPAWEYMHSHPMLDETALEKIGIWEQDGELVGAVHYESSLGEAFFELAAGREHLKPALLDYAEANLRGVGADGQPFLRVYVNDFDAAFEALVRARGYQPDPDYDRPMSQMVIPNPFPSICLPRGFRLQSLREENDLAKIDRVLWRGFNHPGEPPAGGEDDRRKMQSGPHFRHDLNIVVVAPGGRFAAYAGTWYHPPNRLAYVEPVATDPDYRRLGLGKAAVLEGLRRCAALGAETAYVGSDQLFYRAFGFTKIFTSRCWKRFF